MNKLVLDMKDKRPLWARPDWFVDHLRDAIPDDWEIVVIEEDADGSGDGSSRASAAVLEAVRDARVYLGFGIAAEVVTDGWDLEWVHSGCRGCGQVVDSPDACQPGALHELRGHSRDSDGGDGAGDDPVISLGVSTSPSPAWPRERGARIRTTMRSHPFVSCRRASSGSSGSGASGGRSALRASAFGAGVIGLRRSTVQPGERPAWAG